MAGEKPTVDWTGAVWRSAGGTDESGSVVEIAQKDGMYGMRDRRNPGEVLTFTPGEWDAFVKGVHAGEFD
jgi:hypothetical protein